MNRRMEVDALTLWAEQLAHWTPPRKAPAQEDKKDAWVEMAKWYGRMARRVGDGGIEQYPDPVMTRLEGMADARSVVLDVGAGLGRIAIPLASKVGKVLAVESSPAMRQTLQSLISERGADNVEVVAGRWPEVAVPAVDVAFCAHVIYDVAEPGPFVREMDRVATRACYVELTPRHPLDVFRPLWEEFVGWTPPAGPTYLDAVECLRQVGIEPSVEVVPSHRWLWFPGLDEAVEYYRDRLGLAEEPGFEAALRERVAQHSTLSNGRYFPDWQFGETVVIGWTKR